MVTAGGEKTHRRIAAGCESGGGDGTVGEQAQSKESRKTTGMEHLVGWGVPLPQGLNLYTSTGAQPLVSWTREITGRGYVQ